MLTNWVPSKILTTHGNHEHSWGPGLFMRTVRRFSTPIRLSPIRFKVFQPKKKRKNRYHYFFFFSFFFTTCISGDDFSSSTNLFYIAYRFFRCSIHLSSKSAKLSHKYCNFTSSYIVPNNRYIYIKYINTYPSVNTHENHKHYYNSQTKIVFILRGI